MITNNRNLQYVHRIICSKLLTSVELIFHEYRNFKSDPQSFIKDDRFINSKNYFYTIYSCLDLLIKIQKEKDSTDKEQNKLSKTIENKIKKNNFLIAKSNMKREIKIDKKEKNKKKFYNVQDYQDKIYIDDEQNLYFNVFPQSDSTSLSLMITKDNFLASVDFLNDFVEIYLKNEINSTASNNDFRIEIFNLSIIYLENVCKFYNNGNLIDYIHATFGDYSRLLQ